MRRAALAALGLVLLPLPLFALPLEDGGPAAALSATADDLCHLAPRDETQVAYLALVVGAEGLAQDDQFRRAGGEACIPVSAAEG